MFEMKKLGLADAQEFANLVYHAYPGFGFSKEQVVKNMSRFIGEMDDRDAYGTYRDGKMTGGLVLLDFNINTRGTSFLPAGGIALVAVDLLHKKQKIAKEMLTYSLEHFRDKGVNIVTLYPFNSEFYKKMGFGYGAEFRHFEIEPLGFPQGPSKANLSDLTKEDREDVLSCYRRFYENTNGMAEVYYNFDNYLQQENIRVIGYRKDGELQGFMAFKTKSHYAFINDIIVLDMVYNTPEALLEFCTFFRSQADQFRRIVVNTQDEHFLYLLNDPRKGSADAFEFMKLETSTTAIGLMYRVVNVAGVFEQLHDHNFGGQTLKLKLTIEDDFLASNNGSTTIHFQDGRPTLAAEQEDFETELALHVSDFSSLLFGAVDFKSLHRFGLAKLSDNQYATALQHLFYVDHKPRCTFAF